ncbi:MAG: NAD(P)-binding protein [Pseudomonadota bacterium]
MKIAIVGTGISGMGVAYLLNEHADITVYEKNDYIGGHSRTIEIKKDGKTIPVDTGFIVFNERNYPHLLGMFDHLEVPYEKSDMSFGASIANGWLEYGSKGIFAQKANFLRPAYWKMLSDIVRFNKTAGQYLEDDRGLSLGEALKEMKMGDWFKRYYLQAMGAAIWSCSVETIEKFPAKTFIRFFDNHGLLTIKQHPQWYTVSGGSREYIKILTESFKDKIKLNCGVTKVERKKDKIFLTDETGKTEEFDHVVFSSHADQTFAILKDKDAKEHDVLGSFSYQKNSIVVHGDKSFMPKRKKSWASWVYLSEKQDDQNESVCLSYWMNNLQNFDPDVPVFVTLNTERRPQEDLIYDEHEFDHPVFDKKAVDAQSEIESIQGRQNCWYCGAYQRYGFHEDGLLSAVNVVKKMGFDIPWH